MSIRNMGFGDSIQGGFDSDRFESARAEQEAADAAREKNRGKPWRFHMKPNTEANVVFITDGDDFKMVKEHNVQLNGKWGNFFTCPSTVGKSCPLCDGGDRSYDVGFFLVLDRREFTIQKGKRRGEKVSDQIRIFAAKTRTLDQLGKLYSKYGTLSGIEFDVSRSDDRSANVGDQFLPENEREPYDMETIAAFAGRDVEELEEFDWEEYLEILPKSKLVSVAKGLANALDDEDDVDMD